jgi:hypothetical protein
MTILKDSHQSDWLATELPELNASREDSHVRTSAFSESRKVSKVIEADSGRNCVALLASYNQKLRFWKTSQLCLVAEMETGSGESSVTWPKSGMTLNGNAYQLPPLVLGIRGNASGLLPTPAARDWKGAAKPETIRAKGRNPDTNSLPDAVEFRGQSGRLTPEFCEWLMGYPIGYTELLA